MDEQTTTDVADPITDPAPEAAPAEEELPDQGEETSTVESTETGEDATPPSEETELDSDLDDWAAKKGIEVTTDNERKLAQIARDNQRDFTKSRQEEAATTPTNEDGKSLNDITADAVNERLAEVKQQFANDPVMQRLEAMEVQNAKQTIDASITQFFSNNPEAAQHRAAIEQSILSDEVSQQMVLAGHTDRALSDAYKSIQLSELSAQSGNLKREGGKEALTKLSNKQRQAAVKGNSKSATSGNKVTSANADDWYAGLTPAERKDPANQATYSQAITS